MKTLKVLLQEVVSGIKAWVNSNFAQESNTVHKTGNETITGSKTFTGYVQVSNRVAYKDTSVVDKTGSDVYRAVDTYAHQGNDGAYWGGLKHIWFADGKSVLQLAVANHKLNGSTWTQGFWAINLGASKDFSSVYFAPTTNNGINLGTANYQWNHVFAKDYYYNGTEFQNKFVTLDSTQTITYSKTFDSGAFLDVHGYRLRVINDDMEVGSVPASNQWTGMLFIDKNKTNISEIVQSFQNNGNTLWQVIVRPNEANAQRRVILGYAYHPTNNVNNLVVQSDFTPSISGTNNLGTSNQKWKTLNGLNPGILSLLDLSDPDPINTSTWVTDTPTNNAYTPSEDGWLNVVTSHATSSLFSVYIKSGDFYVSTYSALEDIDDNTYKSGLFIPVLAGQTYYIVVKGNLSNITVDATFYPAKGNV